ncbi:MAG: DUF6076 domain-containing protein [Eubacterium sp.]|nr:DUF6076 domain-containing protein [Eubacterium sp.]
MEDLKIGICNFDYFAIDETTDKFYMFGGKKLTYGEFGCAISNISPDDMTRLLILSGELDKTRMKLLVCGGYKRRLYEKAQSQIHNIVDYIADREPFCWFDIKSSLKIVDDVFGEDNLDKFDAILHGEAVSDSQGLKKTFDICRSLISVYIYLANDTANFGTMIKNFTEIFMKFDSRQKENLAECAYAFCNDEKIQSFLISANPNKNLNGMNFRPRTSQAHIILNDEKDKPYIARRVYFSRIMDFLVAEWYEGLMRGHYLWKCGVCGKYFLMTTAHKQLYCKSFNPQYGTTCDHAANNRRIAKDTDLVRQSKKNNPLWIERNKRYASLRKNKSLGKYSEAVTEAAKSILDDFYERAESDFDYAQKRFYTDIELKNLYALAQKMVGGE